MTNQNGTSMTDSWIAQRTRAFDSSGIRKVFELAGKMQSPIDLSIGQPDYDVPEPVRTACIDAIQSGKNNYALTQGMPVLREKLQARIDEQYAHDDRKVFVSSGTSGGLVLTLLSLVNPGDEVIIFEPYFVMYESLTRLVGGSPVLISTYPDFEIPVDQVANAITDKTKLILLNSPANPTGATASREVVRRWRSWPSSTTSLWSRMKSTASSATTAPSNLPLNSTTGRSSSMGFPRTTP